MKRRTLIMALGATFAASSAPAALLAQSGSGAISLAALSNYFNGFSTAQSDFSQINPDGTLVTGQLYISRPGRVRFEYDPPDRNLVLASSGSVNIFDARSNSGPSVYPLSRTPLGLILAERVDLTRARMVVDHGVDGPTTYVVAQDPEHPEYGRIKLVFSADPIELRQWVVTDDMGGETTVILGQLRTGVSIASNLFNVEAEMERRGVRNNH